jgi:hypothetical protein
VLQWAREQGRPWNADEVCDMAARYGHLVIAQWMKEQGCS